MADSNDKLHVAHEADLARLRELWQAAHDGTPHAVHLQAPVGGGKRALTGELARGIAAADDDAILVRVPIHDEEDGLQTLIRIYAGLFQALHRAPLLRGRVEMALNSQLPSQPKRVQGWYQAFVEGLKKGAPKAGDEQFQVILPRDNPLIGFVEILLGIARKFPVLLELQNAHQVQSLGIHAMIEAIIDESFADEDGSRLLLILGTEPLDEVARRWWSSPFLDMLDRRKEDLDVLEMRPWDAEEVRRYLASRGLEGPADDIARVAGGRPGFVAELTDWLVEQDRLGDSLGDLTLADIARTTPEDLEEPEGEPAAGRKHATAEDAERVAYLGALLGLNFPSALLADLGGYDRESVDDLLDATEHLYKELQFSEPLGTWIYQFHRALFRESVLARHTGEEDHQLAVQAASFLERALVPRGYAYLVKTLRMYAEHGEANRAGILRSVALGADQLQIWAMVQDLVRYFDEIAWPDPLRRTVYMQLVERMVQGGDVNQTEAIWNQAMEWATAKEDRTLQAWLLFAGSRLDHRRQDLYRARDRAVDAARMFHSLGDKLKEAEVRNHLALIELADGNPNAALDRAREAEELAPIPPIQAHAEFVRGSIARRDRKRIQEAIEHFRKANELAGRSGMGPLALEAGLAMGEAMLVSGSGPAAADVLGRVVEIARALRSPSRERTATALLAQAHASLQNWEAALQQAQRTLELTRELKYDKLEAIDLYNVGFFNLMLRRPTEAVALFRQAHEKMDATQAGFRKELLFNFGQALLEIGEKAQAEEMLAASLAPAEEARDLRKVVAASRQLAELARERGDAARAREFAEKALRAAEQGNLKEERKALKRLLDQIAN